MEWMAILLVLLSAVLHAGWNLLGKMQATPSLHFFIYATLLASALLTPGLILVWKTLLSLPYLPLILLSGCFQILYLSGLAKSYQHFELSVAYPIVRSLPVILVPIVSGILVHISNYQSNYSSQQWLAYGVIIVGTLLLLPSRQSLSGARLFYIFLAAIGTTGYSITDHFIQRQWAMVVTDAPFTLGYIYIFLQGWATVLIGLIYFSLNKQQKQEKNQTWPAYLQAGLVISGSYFLILVAMVFVKNAGDIVAFRQVSIPIGFLLGVFIMKEQVNRRKVLSVITICLGLLLITIDI